MSEAINWLERNANKFDLTPKPQRIESPEDIEPKGEEVLCWDGCDWCIDYVEVDAETGHFYMANGTEVEAFALLPAQLN